MRRLYRRSYPVKIFETSRQENALNTTTDTIHAANVRQAKIGELNANHAKLMVLISHFGSAAAHVDESESWLRSISLLVLIYEGIQLRVFDLDFAPQSRQVNHSDHTRRIYMNISQEGCGAIDDLLELGLIRALKMISRDSHLITAFQVTAAGREYVDGVSDAHKTEVRRLAFGPAPYDKELVDVVFTGREFKLTTISGYSKISDVTEAEDVSYVTSPYIPATLRVPHSEPLTSNKDRAAEATAGASNKRGASSEELFLSAVQMLTATYLPLNINSLSSLAVLLGAHDASPVGYSLAAETATDEMTSSSSVKFQPGLSRARVLDWDAGNFLNLQTDVHFPEGDGIIQIEEFGTHLCVDGLVLTGVKLEAIMQRRADHISLDDLARVATDIYADSVSILQDLLSPIQQQMMQAAFAGDALHRAPYALLIAAAITPKQPASHYRHRGPSTYELSQVLGTVEEVFEIGRQDLLLRGSSASLLVGPHAHMLEPLMLQWLKLHTMSLFANDVYWRLLQLLSQIQHVSQLIACGSRGPRADGADDEDRQGVRDLGGGTDVGRERELAHKVSHDCLRLEQVASPPFAPPHCSLRVLGVLQPLRRNVPAVSRRQSVLPQATILIDDIKPTFSLDVKSDNILCNRSCNSRWCRVCRKRPCNARRARECGTWCPRRWARQSPRKSWCRRCTRIWPPTRSALLSSHRSVGWIG